MAKRRAKKKTPRSKTKNGKPMLIEIRRHIAGPIRRAPGDPLWLTSDRIRQQGLKNKEDFRVIRT